ncbi:MAG TPA: DNA polymerase III subunit epsilon, partial [Paracoccaceae bacterium]|nr:DNA polymerase III subunit epsilon [Paracoccaceae bacterium]
SPSGDARSGSARGTDAAGDWRPRPRPAPLPPRLTEEEAAAHQALVAKMGDAAIWKKRAG